MFNQTYLILKFFLPQAIDCYKKNIRFYFHTALIMSVFYLLTIMNPLNNILFLLASQLFFVGIELGLIKVTFDLLQERKNPSEEGIEYKRFWRELFSYYYLLPYWLAGAFFKTILIILCLLPWLGTLDFDALSSFISANSLNAQNVADSLGSIYFLIGVFLSIIILSKLYFFDFFLIKTNKAISSIFYSIKISEGRTVIVVLLFILYYMLFIIGTVFFSLIVGPLALIFGMSLKQLGIIFTCLWYQSLINQGKGV